MRAILLFQAFYYGVMALWPLLHMRSFLRVSGPKVDLWLVRTVSWLLLGSAFAFYLGALETRPPFSIIVLSAGNSLALGGIDIYYVAKRRIWRTYLLDALVEAALLVAWVWAI